MQIKATYRRGKEDKVYVNMHAPRDVCMGLHDTISKFLDDEGFREE